MRAAVLVRRGDARRAFRIEERPDPAPGAGQVAIAVDAFGLNFADVLARLGLYPDAPPLPCVLGYEVAGRIADLGEGVTGWAPGDRVMAFTRFGGYATRVLSDARGVMAVPDGLDAVTAAALPVQYGTAWYCAEEMVRLHKGDHVLIQAAAGGVGTALVQIARRRGCVIYGTAGSEEKLAYLRNLGVDYPINYRTEDFATAIRARRGRGGLDVVFDSIGGSAFRSGYRLLAGGRRIVSLGVAAMAGPRRNLLRTAPTQLGFGRPHPLGMLSSSRSIIGVNMLRVSRDRPEAMNRTLAAVHRHVVDGLLTPHVGGTFPMDQLPEAHDFLGARQSIGKVVVTAGE